MTTLDDPNDQTNHMIAARQVQGAKVFCTDLNEVGSIEDMMIDKASGRIAYAIVTTGGFLGMGETHYPLPWEKLRYDAEMGGYIIDVSQKMLEAGPSFSRGAPSWNNEAWARNIYTYYGVEPFWDPAS